MAAKKTNKAYWKATISRKSLAKSEKILDTAYKKGQIQTHGNEVWHGGEPSLKSKKIWNWKNFCTSNALNEWGISTNQLLKGKEMGNDVTCRSQCKGKRDKICILTSLLNDMQMESKSHGSKHFSLQQFSRSQLRGKVWGSGGLRECS